MAATGSTTGSKSTAQNNDLPEFATLIREQLVSTVKQGQQQAVEAAAAWAKAAKAFPTPDLPAVSGLASIPGVPAADAVASYTFDVAQDLLVAQRDFALQLVGALTAKP